MLINDDVHSLQSPSDDTIAKLLRDLLPHSLNNQRNENRVFIFLRLDAEVSTDYKP